MSYKSHLLSTNIKNNATNSLMRNNSSIRRNNESYGMGYSKTNSNQSNYNYKGSEKERNKSSVYKNTAENSIIRATAHNTPMKTNKYMNESSKNYTEYNNIQLINKREIDDLSQYTKPSIIGNTGKSQFDNYNKNYVLPDKSEKVDKYRNYENKLFNEHKNSDTKYTTPSSNIFSNNYSKYSNPNPTTNNLNSFNYSNRNSILDSYKENKASENEYVGFSNLGNTCFMNTSLQLLINCRDFIDELLTLKVKPNSTAEYFVDLVKEYKSNSGKYFSSVSPSSFKRFFERKHPFFSGYNQHDSQEFLRILIDDLSIDCNRVKIKPNFVEIKDKGKSKQQLFIEYHDFYNSRESSLVTDYFYGLMTNTHICENCKHNTYSFERCMEIPIYLGKYYYIL